MKVQVLFNTGALKDGLETGWGISLLVDGHILFDTGEKGEWLLKNLKAMRINPNDIDTVIISHDHWDHTGGLWNLLELQPGLQVYTCPGFTKEFYCRINGYEACVFKHEGPKAIAEGVSVTGEITGQYKDEYIAEQALVIESDDGISVISGCAHPGIIRILERIQKQWPQKPFNAVIGGFHLLNADLRDIKWIVTRFKELGVKKVGPTHCSGQDAEKLFREAYGKSMLSVNAGEIIQV